MHFGPDASSRAHGSTLLRMQLTHDFCFANIHRVHPCKALAAEQSDPVVMLTPPHHMHTHDRNKGSSNMTFHRLAVVVLVFCLLTRMYWAAGEEYVGNYWLQGRASW